MSTETPTPTPKARHGFAAMSPERQCATARKGGKAVHLKGPAHQWTSATAAKAGAIGGRVSRGGRGRLPEAD